MKTIRFWYQNARPVSLPQSMMPALVAAFLATGYWDFRWYLALLSILGIACAHLCFNLFDDYFDYKNAEQGDRTALAREGFRAMTVKCPPLQDGTVTPNQWLRACLCFGALACLFGLPVVLIRGPQVLWVVLGVAILGLFYSAPPLKLGYHGLGELIIGSIFGPGIFIGMSLAAAGEFHAADVLLSVAVGLLVVSILYVHSIMDYAADAKAGKRTLAWLVGCHQTIPAGSAGAKGTHFGDAGSKDSGVRASSRDFSSGASSKNSGYDTTSQDSGSVGSSRNSGSMGSAKNSGSETSSQPSEEAIEAGRNRQYLTLAIIIFLPYILVLLSFILGILHPLYLLSLLAFPWSLELYRSMQQFRKDPFGKVQHKTWYGKFQNWEQMQKAGIDWFMLRWLLAQRISIIFSMLCILASILHWFI